MDIESILENLVQIRLARCQSNLRIVKEPQNLMNKQAIQLIVYGAIFTCLTIVLNIPEWIYVLFKNDVFAEELSLSLFKFSSYPQKSILFQINGDFLLLFLLLLLRLVLL